MPKLKVRDVDVIAPNFKRRLSGVTSTIVQLVPEQSRRLAIATLGPGLPDALPRVSAVSLAGMWRRPKDRPCRVWHARRNNEMIAGIFLRDVLRMPVKLVFTSAAQRRHKPLTKWLIRRMDAVVATSGRSGRFLDVPHSVIMHGIDTERFHPPVAPEDCLSAAGLPGRYAIGCFGRVRYSKGTDLFVEAMIRLLPAFPDWTAVVTGRVTVENRAFAEELEHRIAAAGLRDRIMFLGEVADIRVWYRRISLFVAPSRNEGFGLTPLEAMASQTAVVASDAGAYAEMVEAGVSGAVVPAGDADALTAAIRAYMADPARAEIHGKSGRIRVETEFALKREADGLCAVYERLWQETSMAGGGK